MERAHPGRMMACSASGMRPNENVNPARVWAFGSSSSCSAEIVLHLLQTSCVVHHTLQALISMLYARCFMLDARCSMLDALYFIRHILPADLAPRWHPGHQHACIGRAATK